MAFKFHCPECGGSMTAPESRAGHETECPRCMAVFPIPEPPNEEDEPDPDEPRRPRSGPDDGYDEPERRPRRRRRPPPPVGRGPLFWVAVLLGTGLLGLCTCCGGGYLLIPGEKWQRHESPAGGFSVEAPTPLHKDMLVPGMKPDPNLKVEGGILWKRGEAYFVTYTDLPPREARGATDEAMLDEAVNDMKADPEISRVVRTDPITVSGAPAREIEYVYGDGGTYVGRVIVADRRLYVLVAGGRFARPANANARRFLDSFKLTAPARGNGGRPAP